MSLSSNISLNDTSFQIFLNSLRFYLSPECPLKFLWLVCSTICGKNFSILWCSHSCKRHWIYFNPCPSSPIKTPGRIFWKSVSPKTKTVEETMICFIKIQLESIKMTWNINLLKLFGFCMVCNSFKCDGFSVLWMISIKECGVKFIVSPLHPW